MKTLQQLSIIGGILGLGLVGCSKPQAETAQPPIVRTFEIAPARKTISAYTGVIHARTESDLAFRVGGKIVARLVNAGERVTRGQPLLRIDPTDFELALSSAKSAVDAARAHRIAAAAREKRVRKLLAQRVTSAESYDDAKAEADSASAQLAAAEARAEQAANQLQYTVLEADADGVLLETLAEPGQVVAPGQPVIRLAHDGPREAVIDLPEGLQQQAPHCVATATLYQDPAIVFPAKLRELSALADPVTRTFKARFVLSGVGETASLGTTVTVRLADSGSGEQQRVEVPLGSLTDHRTGPSVWVIDSKTSTVALRSVTIAHLGEETAEVSSGLQPGEQIVSLGAHLLKAGQSVRTGESIKPATQAAVWRGQ